MDNVRDLKIDMMSFIFVGLLFVVSLATFETLSVLGTTRASVSLILTK